jgi:DNA-binding MurR/RpiR family transcriptional regulator
MDDATEIGPLQALSLRQGALTGPRLRVARVLLASGAGAGSRSITEVARLAETSPATVNRLSKELGYDGFPALRAAIAHERGRDVQAGWERDIGREITPSDSPDEVVKVLAMTQTRAIRAAVAGVDLESLARRADAHVAARRVHLFGEWGDSIPARELFQRLFRIGRPLWFHESATAASVVSTLIDRGDVAIAFSRRGLEGAAAEFLRGASAAGALTAAVTGAPESAVGRAAEMVAFGGVAVSDEWLELYAGRSSDTLVTATLWVLVAQRLPGGLGRR